MNTFTGIEIRQIHLFLKSEVEALAAFLERNELTLSELDYALGVYDSEGTLLGSGGLKGDVIKCVAISPELRSEGIAASLISKLLTFSMEEGNLNTLVFTKPEYSPTFSALSFHKVGQAPKAVLLESNPHEQKSYIDSLRKSATGKNGKNGVIVMNANPLTKGHLHLIDYASRQVDHLFIIPVADNPATEFSYSERKSMLETATATLVNVTVCDGSRYVISSATFPSYFIKSRTEATDTHIALDLDIFARHIAPALNVSVRFVGSEPSDPLTARYNQLMPELLAPFGVKVVEIPRLEKDSRAISASHVRGLLHANRVGEAFEDVPQATIPYLLGHAATFALECELQTTPKPGLVDLNDSGSHTDMDVATMRCGISALSQYFNRLAKAAQSTQLPDAKLLAQIGTEAEDEMLRATGGINTHKGALFSLGLTVAAASHILANNTLPSSLSMQEIIRAIASEFRQPAGTHGAIVKEQFGIPTALDQAKDGYTMLFNCWLPFLRQHFSESHLHARLLLKIMADLDDSNIYWRSGAQTAQTVKSEAAEVLRQFSIPGLEQLNRTFISRRISPGGAADMLALTLLIDSLLQSPTNSESNKSLNIK